MRCDRQPYQLFWMFVLTQQISVLADGETTGEVCSREPGDMDVAKTPGDNGFRIMISGRPQPEKYTPAQVYTVSIGGTYPKQRFIGFRLVAVPQNARDESTTIGTFQHLDTAVTKFSDDCFFVLSNVNRLPKEEVEVLWTAPSAGTGCMEFRATVIEHENLWYKDDGALTRTFCEDTGMTENSQSPDMLPECCACGTAKYQMTFHGLWSHQTHPKDFPTSKNIPEYILVHKKSFTDHFGIMEKLKANRQLLQWSNIVGASHSRHYMIWQYGSHSSRGVKEVCEFGHPQVLEEEMRQHSQDIRTIVKTPKIQWSDQHGLEQLRWAHFSVDRKSHLLSMLTMLGPSPDWCVGVSALNLCLANCTWSGDMTLELYPWDAGTDDGTTYMSPNLPTNPPQKIYRITNTYPANSSSPFFAAESIRPMALLKIRQIHPKPEENEACTEGGGVDKSTDTVFSEEELVNSSAAGDVPPDKVIVDCSLASWSEWSDCSSSCGKGSRARTRSHIDSDVQNCDEPMIFTEPCYVDCRAPIVDCAVTEWSEWSKCPCTASPESEKTHRHRSYLDEDAAQTCSEVVEEEENCKPDCSGTLNSSETSAHCRLPVDVGPCRNNFVRWHWDWSVRRCLPFNYGGCRGNGNNFRTQQQCVLACSHPVPDKRTSLASETTTATLETFERSQNSASTTLRHIVKSSQHVFNTTRVPSSSTTKEQFRNSATIGVKEQKCVLSPWSRWSECSATCGSDAYRTRFRSAKTSPKGGFATKQCSRKRREKQKCQLPKCSSECPMDEWNDWSPCSKTCGTDSVQERVRHVLRNSNDPSCGLQITRRICVLPKCPTPKNESINKIPEEFDYRFSGL